LPTSLKKNRKKYVFFNFYNTNQFQNLSGINLPKRKFKGIWEFPLTVFSDLEGPGVCKMPDFECKRYSSAIHIYEISQIKNEFLIFLIGPQTVLWLSTSL